MQSSSHAIRKLHSARTNYQSLKVPSFYQEIIIIIIIIIITIEWVINLWITLMLQEVAEFSTLLLRYKYYAFFDLNPKVSIHKPFFYYSYSTI